MPPERIHIAEPAPPRCSGCFAAQPQKTHIDFGASWDGPTLPPEKVRVIGQDGGSELVAAVGVVGHTIDDLVLCEDCVRHAAKLVGLTDAKRVKAELDQQREVNDRLQGQLAAMQDKVDALERERAANEQLVRFTPRPPARSRVPRKKARA